MRRNAIISIIVVLAFVLMAFSIIPGATSDTTTARQTNIAPLAKPSSNSVGYPPLYGVEHFNDLDETVMCWIKCGSIGTGIYIMYEWPTKYSMSGMKIITHGSWSNPTRRNLMGGNVEWWDGTKWVLDQVVLNQYSAWDITFTQTIKTDKLRVINLLTTGTQASNPCIYEWYVWEGEGGIPADVRLEPQSLNLDSNGNYVQVKVEGFPENPEYTPMDVDGTSVAVGGVGVDLKYGTWNDNRWIGKADRLLVEDSIGAPGNEVEVDVSGSLNDGTNFMGAAIIKAL
jgi:hypothetical protein